jgi:hypothetical protein
MAGIQKISLVLLLVRAFQRNPKISYGGSVAKEGFVPVSEYLNLPRDRETWLLKPLVPISGTCLIYAPPKVGKSSACIQLAEALSQGGNWMGFPVGKVGRVLYLQLDTPRSTWALRFEDGRKYGLKFDDGRVFLADRETLGLHPFDILQPKHFLRFNELVKGLDPIAVIVDTLRKAHTGEENSSTVMSNVINNLVGATYPAALILVSHSRKPSPDQDKDVLADARGSNSIVADMDAVVRMTKRRLYYTGRTIEEGHIKISAKAFDNLLVWEVESDEEDQALMGVLANPELQSIRAKADVYAPIVKISLEAAKSRIRRVRDLHPHLWCSGDYEPRLVDPEAMEGVISPPS